jgi:hypothetical protein
MVAAPIAIHHLTQVPQLRILAAAVVFQVAAFLQPRSILVVLHTLVAYKFRHILPHQRGVKRLQGAGVFSILVMVVPPVLLNALRPASTAAWLLVIWPLFKVLMPPTLMLEPPSPEGPAVPPALMPDCSLTLA